MENRTLTAVAGIQVGHAHHLNGPTGCTVILCPPNTIGGVDQRGGAPGTRETDLLRPMHLIQNVNAILLSGGSAYGLAAATGVMDYLEEHNNGYPVGKHGVVPIVPAAIIFDLDVGDSKIRPDAVLGYTACQNANSDPVREGCVGAGAGARVGMTLGPQHGCKAGVGSWAVQLPGGVIVAALMVVNALGDVVDEHGEILAGVRGDNGYIGALNIFHQLATESIGRDEAPQNTIIGVVATNVTLTKEEVNKVAQMAQDGLAQAVRPAHTMFDGDTIFALATGEIGHGNVNVVGAFAAEVTAQAIRRAVLTATSLAGLPGLADS
jgi:L-aminopeptidase/D-esterase-like protein